MSVYSLVCYVVGALVAITGIALLVMRDRIHRFVRGQYGKMLRADRLADEEIVSRTPGRWMITSLGVGFLIVSSIFIASGALAPRV